MRLGMKTVNNVLRVRHRLTKEEHLQDLLNRKAYSVDVLRAQIAEQDEDIEILKQALTDEKWSDEMIKGLIEKNRALRSEVAE